MLTSVLGTTALDRQSAGAYGLAMREPNGDAQPTPLVTVNSGAGKNAEPIFRCITDELSLVPFHNRNRAPLTRRVLSGPSIHDALERRIVVHELRDVRPEWRNYCDPHSHDFAEINVLLATTELRYWVRLGDETYLVEAPASIHVPAGLVHSTNVFEGSGFFIALLDTANYSATPAPDIRR